MSFKAHAVHLAVGDYLYKRAVVLDEKKDEDEEEEEEDASTVLDEEDSYRHWWTSTCQSDLSGKFACENIYFAKYSMLALSVKFNKQIM